MKYDAIIEVTADISERWLFEFKVGVNVSVIAGSNGNYSGHPDNWYAAEEAEVEIVNFEIIGHEGRKLPNIKKCIREELSCGKYDEEILNYIQAVNNEY